MNRCLVCNVDMGDQNPRQLCGKTHCRAGPLPLPPKKRARSKSRSRKSTVALTPSKQPE